MQECLQSIAIIEINAKIGFKSRNEQLVIIIDELDF